MHSLQRIRRRTARSNDRPGTRPVPLGPEVPEREPAGRRRMGALGILVTVAAMLGGVVFAAPAHADTIREYRSAALASDAGTLMPRSSSNGSEVRIGPWWYDWYVQSVSNSPSGHQRVFLKTAESGGRCLDDHAAASGGAAEAISCNGGDYQLWEVFLVGNARVFKSWGAYTQQGRHLCLSLASTNTSDSIVMADCNVNSLYQQFLTD